MCFVIIGIYALYLPPWYQIFRRYWPQISKKPAQIHAHIYHFPALDLVSFLMVGQRTTCWETPESKKYSRQWNADLVYPRWACSKEAWRTATCLSATVSKNLSTLTDLSNVDGAETVRWQEMNCSQLLAFRDISTEQRSALRGSGCYWVPAKIHPLWGDASVAEG